MKKQATYFEADQVGGGWNINLINPNTSPTTCTRIGRVADEAMAKRIVCACNAYERLIKHLQWINDIVGTACDGGDAWCAVRDWPGASEWVKGMKELLESLGFLAKAKRGRRR